jgi:hypothetical protein
MEMAQTPHDKHWFILRVHLPRPDHCSKSSGTYLGLPSPRPSPWEGEGVMLKIGSNSE